MAQALGPVQTPLAPTGSTVYAIVFQRSTGLVRDVVAGAWDTFTDADWGDYDTALTEKGTASAIYQGNEPSGLDLSGEAYDVQFYRRVGGSPAMSDTLLGVQCIGAENANVTAVGGDAQSATDLKDFADAGYDPSTNKVQGVVLVDTTTTNSDMRGTDSAALATHWTSTRAGYLDNLSAGAVSTAAKLLAFFRLALRSDSAIATDHSTELGEINANVASGAGDYANTTEAQEALRDRGDAAYTTATGFSTPTNVTDARDAILTQGNSAWATATGFSTPTNVTDARDSVLSKLLKYVQLMVRKDSAIATDNATEATAINANGGSGAGAFANTTDALESIRDRGDAAWLTATGFSTFNPGSDTVTVGAFNTSAKSEIRTEAAGALATYDPPTNSEMEARTLVAANYFDPSTDKVQLHATQPDYAPATAAALTTLSNTVGVAGAGLTEAGGTGDHLTAIPYTGPAATAIADATLIRAVSNVENSADKHSLAAIVMLSTNASISGTTVTAKKPSDDTTFFTYTVTVDASADPITGVS